MTRIVPTAVCSRLLLLAKEAPHSGTVHSVFDHAVNLELEGREGLVGLIAEPKTLTPYAVSVRTGRPFSQAGVRAGMAASVADGRIAIPQAEIEIDCSAVIAVDLSLDSIAVSPTGAPRGAQAGSLTNVLKESDAGDSLAPLATGAGENSFTRFLAPRFFDLAYAIKAEDETAAVEAAGRFAGCGMGLTPSSDDLLTGYFAALRLLSRERRANLPNLIQKAAAAAAKKTNRISATFLLQSGEGLVNRSVYELLLVMFQGAAEETVRAAARNVLAIGSNSGADLLTGIALALQQ